MQNSLVRTELLLGSPKNIIGNTKADLVLESLGKIYLKTGNKTKLLNDIFKLLDEVNKSPDIASKILIVSNLQDIKYPGDGMLVFDKTNNALYLTYDLRYILLIDGLGQTAEGTYVKKAGDVMSGLLVIKHNGAPLIVYSKELCKNLNANYLNGYTQEDFARRNVEETISAPWTFEQDVNFSKNIDVDETTTSNEIVGNTYVVNKYIGSSEDFVGGYTGLGWRLENVDGYGSMLTIDYLIVRKAMMVYELIVNRISATNGSLWVTDSAKIESAYEIEGRLSSADVWYYETGTADTLYVPIRYTLGSTTISPTDFKDGVSNANEVRYINENFEFINLYKNYFVGGKHYVIKLTDDMYPTLKPGDIIRCQKFENKDIKYYDAVVITLLSEYELAIQLAPSIFEFYAEEGNMISVLGDLTKPAKDDEIVRIGNIYNKDRLNSVYITSSELQSPYIRTISGVNRPDYNISYIHPDYKIVKDLNGNECYLIRNKTKETTDILVPYITSENYKHLILTNDFTIDLPQGSDIPLISSDFIRALIGNLNSLKNSNLNILGYGLYSDNAYLKGEFILKNGESLVNFTEENLKMHLGNAGLYISDNSVKIHGEYFEMYDGNPSSSDSEKILWMDTYSGLHLKGSVETYFKLKEAPENKNLLTLINLEESDITNLLFTFKTDYSKYGYQTLIVNLPLTTSSEESSVLDIIIFNTADKSISESTDGVLVELGISILLYPGYNAEHNAQESLSATDYKNYLSNKLVYQGVSVGGILIAPQQRVNMRVYKNADGTILWELLNTTNNIKECIISRYSSSVFQTLEDKNKSCNLLSAKHNDTIYFDSTFIYYNKGIKISTEGYANSGVYIKDNIISISEGIESIPVAFCYPKIDNEAHVLDLYDTVYVKFIIIANSLGMLFDTIVSDALEDIQADQLLIYF